jgi:hypothetical protein
MVRYKSRSHQTNTSGYLSWPLPTKLRAAGVDPLDYFINASGIID